MAREPDPAKPDAQSDAKSDAPADPDAGTVDLPVRDAILRLCLAAGPGKSVDPSAIARELGGNPNEVVPWRALIRRIRAATAALQDAGRIVVLRKGKPVDIRSAKGVIRLALGEGAPG